MFFLNVLIFLKEALTNIEKNCFSNILDFTEADFSCEFCVLKIVVNEKLSRKYFNHAFF